MAKRFRILLNASMFIILGIAAISAIADRHWSTLFVVGSALVLSLIPYILDHRYGIHISGGLRFGIVFFLFSTLFLGEVYQYYVTYSWWDIMLHFTAGFGLTLFGFVILKEIYDQTELSSVPIMTSLFAFSFTAMMAVLWETYEFVVDYFALAENQMQNGNTDTMTDMIVALIAALIVCFFGYRYLKLRENNFFSHMIDNTRLSAED